MGCKARRADPPNVSPARKGLGNITKMIRARPMSLGAASFRGPFLASFRQKQAGRKKEAGAFIPLGYRLSKRQLNPGKSPLGLLWLAPVASLRASRPRSPEGPRPTYAEKGRTNNPCSTPQHCGL